MLIANLQVHAMTEAGESAGDTAPREPLPVYEPDASALRTYHSAVPLPARDRRHLLERVLVGSSPDAGTDGASGSSTTTEWSISASTYSSSARTGTRRQRPTRTVASSPLPMSW